VGEKKEITITRLVNTEDNVRLLTNFLYIIDSSFPVPLSQKVSIPEYAKKVMKLGIVLQAKSEKKIIGIITGYVNDEINYRGYISIIGVLSGYRGTEIGKKLLQAMLNVCSFKGMKTLNLYTHRENYIAKKFYEKNGFIVDVKTKGNYEYNIAMVKNVDDSKMNLLLTSVGRRSYLV